jgi:ABC-2 type transport system ATP-binding protein
VQENLIYFGKLWNIDAVTLKENVKIALDVCHLKKWAKLPAIALSSGLRKRLDIACAVIHNPDLLILDDPTSGMDKKASARIFELIRRISKTGTTIILATSSIDDASELCTKVALLQNKSVIGPFLVNDLRKRLGGPQEILLQTRERKYRDLAKILYESKAGLKRAGMRGPWFVAQSDDITNLLHTLLHVCKQTSQKITAIQMNRPAIRDALRAISEVKR